MPVKAEGRKLKAEGGMLNAKREKLRAQNGVQKAPHYDMPGCQAWRLNNKRG
jgi:hypothetical protein